MTAFWRSSAVHLEGRDPASITGISKGSDWRDPPNKRLLFFAAHRFPHGWFSTSSNHQWTSLICNYAWKSHPSHRLTWILPINVGQFAKYTGAIFFFFCSRFNYCRSVKKNSKAQERGGAKLSVHHKNQRLSFFISCESPGVLCCEHGSINETLLCKLLLPPGLSPHHPFNSLKTKLHVSLWEDMKKGPHCDIESEGVGLG